MKLQITFMDGTSEVVEVDIDEWNYLDELLSASAVGDWVRMTGDGLAKWYRVEIVRSIEALS